MGAGFPSQRKNWQLLAYLLHAREARQPVYEESSGFVTAAQVPSAEVVHVEYAS